MSAIIVDLLAAVLLLSASMTLGWWLHCWTQGRASDHSRDARLRLAEEVLTRLDQLATSMTLDLGEHHDRVQRISDELSASVVSRAETVIAAVTRLIDANGQLQRQLATAEVQIQEQARLIKTHKAESLTDALTCLANRRAFDQELARSFAAYQRQQRPFSVLLSDIDRFKDFNDRHGHRAGDEVLRYIAGILHQTMRGTDVVARHGGEEFAAILPGSPIEDARNAAHRVREAVERGRIRFEGQEYSVTTSIGVAQLLPNEHPSILIGRADEALYAAKHAGRNLAYWHDGRQSQPVIQTPAPTIETVPNVADGPATAIRDAVTHDAEPIVLSDTEKSTMASLELRRRTRRTSRASGATGACSANTSASGSQNGNGVARVFPC